MDIPIVGTRNKETSRDSGITTEQDRRDRERRAIEALASAGDVTDPWSIPIQAVGAVLGLTFEESRNFVEDMSRRAVIELVPRRGAFVLQADPCPAYCWQSGSTAPGEDKRFSDARELDRQVHHRIMELDIAKISDYSTSVEDFKSVYDRVQRNWTSPQKMRFRKELEVRLRRTVPLHSGVFPRWNDLMRLEAGTSLARAGCEAALTVQGSESVEPA